MTAASWPGVEAVQNYRHHLLLRRRRRRKQQGWLRQQLTGTSVEEHRLGGTQEKTSQARDSPSNPYSSSSTAYEGARTSCRKHTASPRITGEARGYTLSRCGVPTPQLRSVLWSLHTSSGWAHHATKRSRTASLNTRLSPTNHIVEPTSTGAMSVKTTLTGFGICSCLTLFSKSQAIYA